MIDKSFSREYRIIQPLKFSDEIQALFEEELSQNLIEELLERIGNFFNVGKIYFVKCFGINYWEVRITWTKTKQF